MRINDVEHGEHAEEHVVEILRVHARQRLLVVADLGSEAPPFVAARYRTFGKLQNLKNSVNIFATTSPLIMQKFFLFQRGVCKIAFRGRKDRLRLLILLREDAATQSEKIRKDENEENPYLAAGGISKFVFLFFFQVRTSVSKRLWPLHRV